ncbi:nuclear autoantigen Sp-100 isoform X1 [Danio aesculapii]|nr:nuclear autoantigen Sp-100 isoform X1 [Danio aesculapii]
MDSDSDSYEEMEGGRRKMPERTCKKEPIKEVSFLSGSESEFCPDSSMASDSENYEKYEEREDERRKVADRLCKKGPSRDYRPNQKRTKNQLPVTCGEKEGILYLLKYNKVQPCILSEGQWFTPTEFERFGKKERNKKWKISIFYYGIPLQTFIEDGLLSSPNFRFQTDQKQDGGELSFSDSDSPEHHTDGPEPAGSSVIEEADQTSEEQEGAADPMNECQNPIDSQETRKTDQMQLFELLAKRFNTMNSALKSVDSSLKTFMKK